MLTQFRQLSILTTSLIITGPKLGQGEGKRQFDKEFGRTANLGPKSATFSLTISVADEFG